MNHTSDPKVKADTTARITALSICVTIGPEHQLEVRPQFPPLAAMQDRIELLACWSIASDRVHDPEKRFTIGEPPHVQAYPLGQHRQHHLDRVRRVRSDDARRELPQRVAVGEWLRIRHVEGCAGDDPGSKRFDQFISHHVLASSNVDQPGGLAHRGEFGSSDDPDGRRREREGKEDHLGSRQDIA